MRLISYRKDGELAIGVRGDDGVVDLAAAQAARGSRPLPSEMRELLALGDEGLEEARAAAEFASGRPQLLADGYELLPVVLRPPKVICVARNYGAHAKEANLDVLEYPNLFIRFPRSLIAAGDAIVVPKVSDKVDWEAELAVVIGRPGKHVSQEDALKHVAGYALFNDVSIRDWQLRVKGGQFGAGKNFDGSGPLGPDLVTKDEVGDSMNLSIRLSVNGETKQDSSTGEMIFSVPVLIEFITKFTTLEPGDVIATGTPSGVGHFRHPPEYLKAGDVVEMEIERVGKQSNPVAAEAAVASAEALAA
jgi:2-keto-4-pentenoate hydratase/2-oxohepta-3-ene-1,7-dioic acid hydratase in catechol pathway